MEVKGNIRQKKSAHKDSMKLNGTKLLLSGKEKQVVDIVNENGAVCLDELEIRNEEGVEFTDPDLQLNKVSGMKYIANELLTLRNSVITLENDETYNGTLILCKSGLYLNGHKFRVGQELEQYSSDVIVDGGILYVGGSYSIYGQSRLFMMNKSDYVVVYGDFFTASSLYHEGFLSAGSFKLAGNLEQDGDPKSFATSDDFMIAFIGEGVHQVHCASMKSADFANVDPANDNYVMNDNSVQCTQRMIHYITLGIMEGIQETLLIAGLSAVARQMMTSLNITVATGTVLAAPVVSAAIPALILLALTISHAYAASGALNELHDAVISGENEYEKARIYARTGTKLLISVASIADDIGNILKTAKALKKIYQEAGRSGNTDAQGNVRLTVNSAESFLEIIKEFVDEDAYEYLEKIIESFDAEQLSDFAQIIQEVQEGTAKVLVYGYYQENHRNVR